MTPPSQRRATGLAMPPTRAVPARREEAASAPERFTSVIDVHVILRRAGQILLLRRPGMSAPAASSAFRRDTWSGARASGRPLRARLSRRPGSPSTRRCSVMSCRFSSVTPELPTPGPGSRSRPACGTASPSTPSRTSIPGLPGLTPPPCPLTRRVHRRRDHGRGARPDIHAERLVAVDGAGTCPPAFPRLRVPARAGSLPPTLAKGPS